MRLDRSFQISFFPTSIAPWLSAYNVNVFCSLEWPESSENILRSQMDSLTAENSDFSASTVECATNIVYFSPPGEETEPSAYRNTKLLTDFLSRLSAAKSKSVKPCVVQHTLVSFGNIP